MSGRETPLRTTLYYGLLALAAILLLVTTGLSISASVSLRNSIASVTHSQNVLRRLSNVAALVSEAEAYQRGYLLTADESFLKDYEDTAAQFRLEFDALESLVADNPEQITREVALRQAVESRLAFARDTNATARGGALADAARRSTSTIPVSLATQARRLVQQMEHTERMLLDERQYDMYRLLSQNNSTIIVANTLALAAGAIAVLMMRRSRDAWERKRLAELDAATARAASREKSSFLASMSHEIRTPMNAIFGFTQLLAQSVTNPREQQFVHAIQTSGQSLLALINDILDLSKIEAGHLELNPVATDVREVIDSSIAVFTQMASEKLLRLRADVDPRTPPSLVLDPTRLRQIVFNLIGNAVKFTEQGGVTVRVWSEPATQGGDVDLHIAVDDTGVGIQPDQLKRIFEPFVQARVGDGRVREGSGLGLSIAKRLVDRMNADLSVRSEAGRGSSFQLRFRALHKGGDALRASSVWEDVDLNALPPSRILIVDDVAWNRDLLVGFFASTHHRTSVADSGREALEMARQERPDLVLMDIRMPEMDGRQTLRRMLDDPLLKNIPVVAVTASSLSGEEADLRKLFAGYLRKPLSKSELLQVMQPLLGKVPIAAAKGAAIEPVTNGNSSGPELAAARERMHILSAEVWPRLRDTVAMRESRAFANELQQLGQVLNDAALSDYGRRLGAAVDSFDVTTVESTLHQFPDHAAQSLVDPHHTEHP